MNARKLTIGCAVLLAILGISFSAMAETVVTLTDEVLIAGMPKLGVHTSGDNYYDACNRKMRVEENFEGVITRFMYRVTVYSNTDVEMQCTVTPEMADTLRRNPTTYTVMAGPSQWQTGPAGNIQIVDVPNSTNKRVRFTLDRPFTPGSKENYNVFMLSCFDPRGYVSYSTIGSAIGSQITPNHAMISGDTTIITTDGAPAFGTNSLRLNGTSSQASYLFFTHESDLGATNGTWKARFMYKAQSGSPTLRVGPDEVSSQQVNLTPSSTWQQVERTFTVNANPEYGHVHFRFAATSGAVLIDDVEIWREGDSNPTDFRDDHVNVIDFLQPGVMRYLVNRADTIQNRIDRSMRAYAHRTGGSISKIEWGMHQFFELAEYCGFEPWYTLPGTMTPQDIQYLMEYLNGPTTTPGGAKRAALGRTAPWTTAFKKIFCQYGNEWITFSGTGYPAIGYWEALNVAAKNSPYYDSRISFVTDSQGGGGWNLDLTPSSDMLCLGGYMNYGLYNSMLTPFDTDQKLAQFVLSIPIQQWNYPEANLAYIQDALSRGKEPCVYEGGNFHTTFGATTPVETVNRIVAGHVGAMAAVHNMLYIQSKYGVRYQNSFNYSQKSFSPGGSFGDIQGNVLLWGGLLSQRPETLRYRPRFLIMAAANRAIGGDNIRTNHTGPDASASYTVNGLYSPSYANRYEANLVSDSVILKPIISYAYKDGSRRGLILINQDPYSTRQVQIVFSGGSASADWWRVAPSNPFANNENEAAAPQVVLEQGTYSSFGSGYTVSVPPVGILSLSWLVGTFEPTPPSFVTDPIVKADGEENQPYSGSIASDAMDPNPGDTLTFSKLSGPAWLTVAANGALSGTPTSANVGINDFSVQVSDGVTGSDTATLRIEVVGYTPAAPSFNSDPIVKTDALKGTPYSGSIAADATDPNPTDVLTFSKISGPDWLTVGSDGTLSGTPGVADLGLNSFTVQVDDGNGGTDTATLEINVTVYVPGGEIEVRGSGYAPAVTNTTTTTTASFTATNSGTAGNYLIIAAVSETSNVTSMTFNGSPMTQLYEYLSTGMVEFFGIATSSLSGTVNVTYSGNIYGTQIYGYAFLDGVDTASPLRATAGGVNASGTGSLTINYSAAAVSGDFAMLASNKNNKDNICSVSPVDTTLYTGNAGASFSGLAAYDAALADGAYSSTFTFTVGTAREVAGGVILKALPAPFVPNPDITGEGDVNLADFAMLAAKWLNSPCAEPAWCDDADIDHSGAVDIDDLGWVAESWLQ